MLPSMRVNTCIRDVISANTMDFQALSRFTQQQIRNSLDRGTVICQNNHQLMAYMALYGDYHRAKLESLFGLLLQSKMVNQENISVIDYGCGQGIGSLVLHEQAMKLSTISQINELVLIEPSTVALEKAIIYNAGRYADIKAIAKPLASLDDSDIQTRNDVTIHIFSNVLDMQHIQTQILAQLIKANCKGHNFFVCCSPNYYSGNASQNRFVRVFEVANVHHVVDSCPAQGFDIYTQQQRNSSATRYAQIFHYAA